MPNFLGRIALFLSSYAPLLLIFALRAYDTSVVTAVVVGAVVATSVIAAAALFYTRRGSTYLDVSDIKPRDEDVMAYVLTYLVPFLGIDVTRAADLAAFVVFIVVVGVIYIHTNLLFVNPLLTILAIASTGLRWRQ